jgi:uncharacterized protein YdbL (DUF1318 family)
MWRLKTIGVTALVAVLLSCVTVNVYFPAVAADSAAKTIVRDVLGEEGAAPEAPRNQGPEQGSRLEWGATYLAAAILELIVPSAQAGADLDINTPAITTIRASLKQRQPQLQPYFDTGALGLTRDGLVGIRDGAAIPLKDRNRVKKLVADENRDRNGLYREIARANGHPEWEPDIRNTFARVWVEESRPGIWYQDAGGQWQRK